MLKFYFDILIFFDIFFLLNNFTYIKNVFFQLQREYKVCNSIKVGEIQVKRGVYVDLSVIT